MNSCVSYLVDGLSNTIIQIKDKNLMTTSEGQLDQKLKFPYES